MRMTEHIYHKTNYRKGNHLHLLVTHRWYCFMNVPYCTLRTKTCGLTDPDSSCSLVEWKMVIFCAIGSHQENKPFITHLCTSLILFCVKWNKALNDMERGTWFTAPYTSCDAIESMEGETKCEPWTCGEFLRAHDSLYHLTLPICT